MEITKARVLEVFMAHYNRIEESDANRHALLACNSTQDELIPWKKDRSEEERARSEVVLAYLDEILQHDFGITIKPGKKVTPIEKKGSAAGGVVAIEWLKDNASRVPPLEKMQEDPGAWMETVNRWAFDLVPSDRAAEQEWTRGFIMGFTGDVLRHIQGLPPVGAGWDRPDPDQ